MISGMNWMAWNSVLALADSRKPSPCIPTPSRNMVSSTSSSDPSTCMSKRIRAVASTIERLHQPDEAEGDGVAEHHLPLRHRRGQQPGQRASRSFMNEGDDGQHEGHHHHRQ